MPCRVQVYTCYFKTNAKRIADYPNLLGFVRDVYSIEAVRGTTNLTHVKAHYFTSHPKLNHFGTATAAVFLGPPPAGLPALLPLPPAPMGHVLCVVL